MGAKPSSPTVVMIVACLAQFMVILDVSIVNVALPSIQGDLGFSETGLQWVVNAYTLTFAGFLMLGGRAADLFGRRRIFLFGIGVFALASVACAVADSQGLLLAARALQGIGGAIISPASLAILSTSFEGQARSKALGVWGAMGGLGGAAGVFFGGVIIEVLSWPWIFAVNVPIGLAVIAVGRAAIPESTRDVSERHFDIAGAVLVTVGLATLVFGIVRTEEIGWGSLGVLGPIGGALLVLAAFVLVESRVAAPLMPLRIFRIAQLRSANLLILLLGSALFAMWYFLTLYMQEVLGASALRTGLQFLPMTAAIIVASTQAPKLLAKFGPRVVLTGGLLSAGLGLFLLSGVSADGSYAADVLPGGLLAAFGLGMSLVPSTIIGVADVPPSESGLASGLLNASRLVGGALGLAVLTTIAVSHTSGLLDDGTAGAVAATEGYGVGFEVGAGICLVAALAAATLLRQAKMPGQAAPVAAESG